VIIIPETNPLQTERASVFSHPTHTSHPTTGHTTLSSYLVSVSHSTLSLPRPRTVFWWPPDLLSDRRNRACFSARMYTPQSSGGGVFYSGGCLSIFLLVPNAQSSGMLSIALRRKSLYSCADGTRRSLILNHAICASIHSTTLCLCGGHIWNWSLRIHSSGIRDGSVCSIQAIPSLVHSQIAGPAPHPFIRCKLVSFSPHILQRAE